jgi:hypothetical protein
LTKPGRLMRALNEFPRASGEHSSVADYWQTDIVNTYRVWLRYELFAAR